MADVSEYIIKIDLKGDANTGLGKLSGTVKKVSGDIDKAGASVAKAEGRFGALGAKLKSPELRTGLLQGVGLSAGLIGFQALTAGIGKVADVLGDAVRAASEEEAAIAQLTQAIKANDEAWDGNIDAVEALITARQQLAFADSEQRESLQLLVGFTKDVTEAQKLMATAMDFARFRNIDLRTASDLLGKAYAGNTSLLSRYGIVVDKGATATETLAKVQKLAQGQAETFANTTEGRLVRSQIKMGDAMENVGRALIPVADAFSDFIGNLAGVVAGSDPATERVARLTQAMKDNAAATRDAADAVEEFTAPLASYINVLALGISPLTEQYEDDLLALAKQLGLTQVELDELVLRTGIAGGVTTEVADNVAALVETLREEQSAMTALAITTAGLSGEQATLADETGAAADATGDLTATTTRATGATRRLTSATIDMAAATGIAVKGYKAEKNELRDLIQQANKVGRQRENTAERLKALTEQEVRLRERQATAAEKGEARKVAALQLAIEKNNAMQAELQATLELTKRLNSTNIIIDIKTRGSVNYGGIVYGPGSGGADGDPTTKRASGGPVLPGRAYLVGEQGPELRTFGTAGMIHSARSTRDILAGAMRPMVVAVRAAPITAHRIIEMSTRTVSANRSIAS